MAEVKTTILCSANPNVGEYWVNFSVGGTNTFERKLLRSLPGAGKERWAKRGPARQVCRFQLPLENLSPEQVMATVEKYTRLIAGHRGKVILHPPTAAYPSWERK